MDIEWRIWVTSLPFKMGVCGLKCIGDILLCGIALGVTIFLFILTERRKAAVGTVVLLDGETKCLGRREMEIVLLGYFLINVCEIFSLGGFLTNLTVVRVRLSVLSAYTDSVVVLSNPSRPHNSNDMGFISERYNRIPNP